MGQTLTDASRSMITHPAMCTPHPLRLTATSLIEFLIKHELTISRPAFTRKVALLSTRVTSVARCQCVGLSFHAFSLTFGFPFPLPFPQSLSWPLPLFLPSREMWSMSIGLAPESIGCLLASFLKSPTVHVCVREFR